MYTVVGKQSSKSDFEKFHGPEYISATDIARISTGQSLTVWAEKTKKQTPMEQTPEMLLGKLMQLPILKFFEHKNPEYVVTESDEIWQSTDHPFAVCSPDAILNHPARGVGLCETKKRSIWQKSQWSEDHIPDDSHVQHQWQLGVSGYRYGHVAGLIGGSASLFYSPMFEASDQVFVQLLAIANDFIDYVKRDIPPSPSFKEKDLADVLAGDPVPSSVYVLDPSFEHNFKKLHELTTRRKDVGKLLKEYDEQMDQLKAQLTIDMGSCSVLECGEYSFTRKRIDRKGHEVKAGHYYKTSITKKGEHGTE